MSILLVLVMFLLFCTISYLHGQRRAVAAVKAAAGTRHAPALARERGFEIPQGYCFHPGHTWVLDEGRRNARVGMDRLAATLLGKIERVEVPGLGRWVRQGQKIWTVKQNGLTVDMLAPVEGVVVAANPKVLQDPSLAVKDPYGEGWVLLVQSPELGTNLNNLIRGSLVRPWIENSLDRLAVVSSQVLGTVQDGGPLLPGALAKLEPGLQHRVVREFFLT